MKRGPANPELRRELHAMAEPAVLRRCLDLIREAVHAGEAEPSQAAGLVDRLALIERSASSPSTRTSVGSSGSTPQGRGAPASG